jgi:dihydrodiol dehydrogenase / D-xylose 1-dehydrogenase (NADP)
MTMSTRPANSDQIIRWGILGTGSIATTFTRALAECDGAEVLAVGSRTAEKAASFAAQHGVARGHGSYEELAADPGVDAIYIATPHSFHCDHTILCLEHGKHVLCEKPFAINAEQAGRMVKAAAAADRLLMEAMWTRFLPSMARVREVIAEGIMGDLHLFRSNFGIQRPFNPHSRLFDPELGGGALLDLGVYAVSMGCWFFGPPSEITGTAHMGMTGTDDDSAFVMRHAGGRFTMGYQSLRVETSRDAVIRGTGGALRIRDPWWGASRFRLKTTDGEKRPENFELRGNGYCYIAEAFMDLIRVGARDNDVISQSESVQIMSIMDSLRDRWGLRYPCEE